MKARVRVRTRGRFRRGGAKDHIAAFNGAPMFDLQVNGVIMDFESTFVIERLPTRVAEHSSFREADSILLIR